MDADPWRVLSVLFGLLVLIAPDMGDGELFDPIRRAVHRAHLRLRKHSPPAVSRTVV